jgi:hypothetical protein
MKAQVMEGVNSVSAATSSPEPEGHRAAVAGAGRALMFVITARPARGHRGGREVGWELGHNSGVRQKSMYAFMRRLAFSLVRFVTVRAGCCQQPAFPAWTAQSEAWSVWKVPRQCRGPADLD